MRALILLAALSLAACEDDRPDQPRYAPPEVNAETENTVRDAERNPPRGTQIP